MKTSKSVFVIIIASLVLIICVGNSCLHKEVNDKTLVLEVSIADFIRTLSGNSNDVNFNKAIDTALSKLKNGKNDYVTLFAESFNEIDPDVKLASIFSVGLSNNKINTNSTDKEVIEVIRKEVDEAFNKTIKVLETRLKKFNVKNPSIKRIKPKDIIEIELPSNKATERLKTLLQITSKVEFWNTYEFSELTKNFTEADKILAGDNVTSDKKTNSKEEWYKEHPLFAAFVRLNVDDNGVPSRGPSIGMAYSKDIPKINNMFEKIMTLHPGVFPGNAKFLWTAKPIDDKNYIFQLIILKSNDISPKGTPALSGDIITNARQDYDQAGKVDIVVYMNPFGAKMWESITDEAAKASPKRCIGIVLDDKVYSFPTVNAKISKGASTISGRYTKEEAQDIATVLMLGALPLQVRIINE